MSDFTVVSVAGEAITVVSQYEVREVVVPTGGLQGPAGASAYQVAVANGFVGTEAQWIASLAGPPGAPGEKGDQGDQGIQGVAGTSGDPGADGIDGASAYEIALANGFVGTQEEWLESLVGASAPSDLNAITIDGMPVSISTASPGDILRFNGSAWANYPEQNIVDGGNF